MVKHALTSLLVRRSALVASLALGLIAFAVGSETPKNASKKGESATCCSAEALTGIWTGEYRYPGTMSQRPVTFTVFLFQDGERVTALIKEPNSFGDNTSPWLHATADGRYDKESKTLSFTKSYDGTGGVSHDVVYKGHLSSGATETVSGTWDISGLQGTFTMKRKSCCN
jgi:hypothetical protein